MCTSTLFCLFAPQVVHLLGSSERLKPLAVEYMCWFVPFSAFTALLNSGMFFLRLDGSPNFAMMCNVVAAVLNIILDYLFIFPFGWGMFGASFTAQLCAAFLSGEVQPQQHEADEAQCRVYVPAGLICLSV